MGKSLFLYIKAKKSLYESFPWYIGKKRHRNYLLRHLPYESNGMVTLGREGLEIELPFTKKQLEAEEEQVLSDILYRLQIKTGISYIAVEDSLEACFSFEWVCDGKSLPLFLAEGILDEIGLLEKIPKKKMNIVILAGDDIYASYLLEELGKTYNFISLVAQDEAFYSEKLKELYEEYGLAVSFYEKEVVKQRRSLPEGNIFIDFTGRDNSYCRLLPKGAVLLDFLREKDVNYYLGKREDLKVYNDFSFGKEEEISAGLIQAVLEQESSWLMKGALEEYGQLVKALDLKVFSAKVQFS